MLCLHTVAPTYPCATPVLRFYDGDPRDAPDPRLGTTSLLDYAQDLQQEIERLGVRSILMGHSIGGLLAQMLGSRGLAKALVLLAPASPAGIMALTPSVIKSFWSAQVTTQPLPVVISKPKTYYMLLIPSEK